MVALIVWVIGAAGVLAQTPSTVLDALAVPVRDERLSPSFAERFAPDRPEDWARGFALAERLGRIGVPLLAELAQRRDADVRRRTLALAAMAIAGGRSADAALVTELTAGRGGKEGLRERFVLCLVLGLSGPRASAAPELAALAGRSRTDGLEQAALALALARFTPRQLPPDWLRSDEPAVVAAVVFARPPEPVDRIHAWLGAERSGAALVQRGFLLGEGSERQLAVDQAWIWRILGDRGEEAESLRAAAALCIARAADPEPWLAHADLPRDAEMIAWLATEPTMRAALWHRQMLQPAPTRLPAELRARTAVAFALEADGPGLAGSADEWRRDPVASRALCLAIAWRFYLNPERADPRWLRWLPDVRELEWVRLACGQAAAEPSRSMTDEALDRAFVVAVAPGERLGRRAAAAAIEDALWRAGAHPDASRIQAEQDLIRDLLLSGSEYGSAVLGLGTDPRRRYLPPGLPEGDPIFKIGFELYRFMRDPARPRPAAAHLR